MHRKFARKGASRLTNWHETFIPNCKRIPRRGASVDKELFVHDSRACFSLPRGSPTRGVFCARGTRLRGVVTDARSSVRPFLRPVRGELALRNKPKARFHDEPRYRGNFTRSTEIFIFSFRRAGTVQRNFL